MMKTILVVENDDYIRLFLSSNLRARGIDVMAAQSLESAHGFIGKSKPDAIILDVMLDDGNGLDFAREIYADPYLRHVPVIIMTASSENFTLSEDYPNVVYRLLKPIDVKRLFTAITEVQKGQHV
jgi:CheY-like chemotaxis protein